LNESCAFKQKMQVQNRIQAFEITIICEFLGSQINEFHSRLALNKNSSRVYRDENYHILWTYTQKGHRCYSCNCSWCK